MSEPNNVTFWSGKNYMKRDISSGQDNLAAPSILLFSANYTTQKVITHNLGIVPFFDVYYEPFKDGVIWEAGIGARSNASVVNPRNTAQTGPYCLGYADETTLTIEIGYLDATLTGTYPVYWVIYKDYGLL